MRNHNRKLHWPVPAGHLDHSVLCRPYIRERLARRGQLLRAHTIWAQQTPHGQALKAFRM